MTNHKSLNQAARLSCLLALKQQGRLEGLSGETIGNMFFTPPVLRNTIYRDLRLLPELEAAIKAIRRDFAEKSIPPR